ncbi:MAG: hypothetical protein K8S55_06195, partial [Phycisphaerae bacterium]|nr:hypothetical protein [Phycisphaerae bacterium]
MNLSAANSNHLSRRFGIGEWYGKSFVRLTPEERKTLAEIALGCDTNIVPPCPFKDLNSNEPCTKKGGVCSLRLYEDAGDGSAVAVTGDNGDLRTVCPHRFKQGNTIYKTVGEYILGAIDPRIVSEVRFLQRYRVASSENAGREDVGNIDNVLVHPTETNPMRWCALEIQAVYFSGKAMSALF